MTRNYLLYFFGTFVCFISNTSAIEAIIGAQIACPNEFPYQVSIHVMGTGHNCGGGILNENFILSAAHCLLEPNGRFMNKSMSVIAGTNNMQKPGAVVAVKKLYVLTEYNVQHVLGASDISVLKLNNSLELSNNGPMQRLRLPRSKQEDYNEKTAVIAGFGYTWSNIVNHREIGGFNDSFLRYGDTIVLNQTYCQYYYPDTIVTSRMMCAHMKQHNDPFTFPRGVCLGDSGGPLVYNRIAIGIFTAGPPGCSEWRRPALYTRVSHYLAFINNAMKDKITRYIRTLELIQ